MGRREMIATTTAGAAALLLGQGAQARSQPAWFAGRQGFLSQKNPLATEGQRRVEDRALALLQRPELVKARAVVTTLWQAVTAWPMRDQADRFAAMIDEYMFHHAFRAANCDPDFPEVARFMAPPHHWFGRDVPGSRWAGDSPDFVYRTIPIVHGGRYEIHGTPTSDVPPIVFWSLMSENTAAPQTLALLESADMAFQADGSFVVTVDDTPPNGRRNHLQTRPGAEFLMIRDALGDWMTQSANALTVRRLDPGGGPKSVEGMARHAAKIAIEGVYYSFYITQNANLSEPNQVRAPMSSAVFGGVATQWGTIGRLDLLPDDAIIVRCNAAGARFRNLTIKSLYMLTVDYWKRTTSFNMQQMAADADGDFTFVIAHQDPGVHNWLDTGGLRRTLFGQRWQAFAREGATAQPWMTTKLVKLDALEKSLPDGVRRLDAAGRKAQIGARQTGFDRRFIDV